MKKGRIAKQFMARIWQIYVGAQKKEIIWVKRNKTICKRYRVWHIITNIFELNAEIFGGPTLNEKHKYVKKRATAATATMSTMRNYLVCMCFA